LAVWIYKELHRPRLLKVRSGGMRASWEQLACRCWPVSLEIEIFCSTNQLRIRQKSTKITKTNFERKETARPSRNPRRRINREWTPMNANLRID
jgi:hypothetical protein